MFFSKWHLLPLVIFYAGTAAGIAPASGAPTSLDKAVSDFKAKKYSLALSEFQEASRRNPQDPLAHYYAALCCHYNNQFAQAIQQYQWVAVNCRDPLLRSRAQSGLTELTNYQSAQQSRPQSQTGSTGRSPATGAAVRTDFAPGKMRVIEFKTSWCHVCKEFEPVFEQTRSSRKYYSLCSFDVLDAESPDNAELVQKYEIRAYPTTVLVDSLGKQIDRFSGGLDAASLERFIDRGLEQIPG